MDFEAIRDDILGFVRTAYPEMEVRVERWPVEPGKTAIYFVEPKFALIYPMQRYHHLSHLIPRAYQEQHLANSVWFELAPGERPEDLQYPDEQFIADITDDVMKCVVGARALEALDDLLCPSDGGATRAQCHGDFRSARSAFLARGFKPEELFEVLHVLMAKGGFCDCEILFNVATHSRLAEEYWRARANGSAPPNPHGPL